MITSCRILILVGAALAPWLSLADDAPYPRLPTLSVAALIYQPTKWDKDANQRRLTEQIRKAKAEGAQLVVTPEGALEGYVVNEVIGASGQERRELTKRFNALAEPSDSPRIKHFERLCKELDLYLVLCFLEADAGKTYNTAVLIGPEGTTLGKYRKTHFAQGYEQGDEKGQNPPGYTRGDAYPVFKIGQPKIGLGIMICFDRRKSKVAKRLVENGADLIVNPAYGMHGDCNCRYIGARVKENGVPILLVHPKQALLVQADGTIAADLRPGKRDSRIGLVTIEVPGRRSPIKP